MSITCSSISNYLSVLPGALKISGSRARLIRSDCEHPVTAIKLSEAFFFFFKDSFTKLTRIHKIQLSLYVSPNNKLIKVR